MISRLLAGALLLAAFVAGPAQATVELRVEARPIADPIQAFVTVTDTNGPVGGLNAADFTVSVDGLDQTITSLELPPAQDPNQKVSVVFVMDYSDSVTAAALEPMRDAVIAFIDEMSAGDVAAVIKFNADSGASVVAGFTVIDDAGPGDVALTDAVMGDYLGNGTNLLDAINLAVDQFVNAVTTLPDGPKAIIIVSDGGENESTATATEVIANATTNSIPVFGVGVGDLTQPGRTELMTDLSAQTGGEFFPAPTEPEIADAYVTIKELLSNEYLLTIPSAIADCEVHTLEVTVTGQGSDSATFTRRECDTSPNPFSFTSQTGVAPASDVTSNEVTITGIEVPTPISVHIGRYSIGCGTTNAEFTDVDGTISNGDTLCLRHSSHSDLSSNRVTTVTIGDFSTTFTSTTSAVPPPPPPPPPGGGGGGTTGIGELLLGLLALLYRQRRPASA